MRNTAGNLRAESATQLVMTMRKCGGLGFQGHDSQFVPAMLPRLIESVLWMVKLAFHVLDDFHPILGVELC